ncbi:MAG: endonuclease/exonuclease/phosphatase family protein [Flavobacteriaceae bacterium]|nr:endonuclease/exonuclease/phosphatase family protein [Flavobacteriaceae bacterium]
MKNLSPFDGLMKLINSIVALCLVLAILVKYISPNNYAFTVFISLGTPILLFANLLFLIYWIVQIKRPFLISAIALAISFMAIQQTYGFEPREIMLTKDLKVMSYNVRMFNVFEWIKNKDIESEIVSFVKKTSPDVLCIQEYYPTKKLNKLYPYRYKKTSIKKTTFGQAIYSKYKIIKSGSLNFPNSNNNAIFADIVKGKDTIRIYNVHLESLGVNPRKENFGEKTREKLRNRMEKSFKKQGLQASLLVSHEKECHYKIILCGDFNNNAFSWVYHQLKNKKKDAFVEAGDGFGKTFDYPFPLRIDFILSDETITVNHFKTYTEKLSDHYPIMARLQLN